MSVVQPDIDAKVNEVEAQVVAWRRHLHSNPELSFQEVRTAQFVYDTLSGFSGLELSRPTPTSVVAKLRGQHPGGVLAIRADMDALPIQEENSFDFVSKAPGVMHACGHDGHTAMLLGTVKVLTQMRHLIHGEVRFLFQHAEELFPGGAAQLVDAGVLDGVDNVIGIHLIADIPTGRIEVGFGPLMASADVFTITVHGRGGHAAHPESFIDSIAIGAQIVTNLQHVVARSMVPHDPVVLSVTKFHAGTADNIIPETAEIVGTVRCFKPELRQAVRDNIDRIVKGITQAHGADYDYNYRFGYLPVLNDAALSKRIYSILENAFGPGVVAEAKSSMGAEDFSAYQQKVPGTFFWVGAGNAEKGITYPHHHPRFTVDEDSLRMGVKAFLHCALELLA